MNATELSLEERRGRRLAFLLLLTAMLAFSFGDIYGSRDQGLAWWHGYGEGTKQHTYWITTNATFYGTQHP